LIGMVRRAGGIGLRATTAVIHRATGKSSRAWNSKKSLGLVPVLMYHRVIPDEASTRGIEPGMYVRASTFERHIRWLADRFELATLSEVVDATRDGRTAGLAAITFDDGWRDNLTHAWPVLRRHGARATVFLVTDWVNAAPTPDKVFLSPGEVRSLADNGVELGAHTTSHPMLDQLPPDQIENELRASKLAVESWTGRRCRTFAYPYGRFGEAAVAAAARHFDASVQVGGGWWNGAEPLARIPRITIHDDVTRWVPMLEARLAGIH